MKYKRLLALVMVLILCLFAAGCGNENEKETAGTGIDYAKSDYWLAMPASVEKEADVFYLYPTVWQKAREDDPNICSIDEPAMLENAKKVFAIQATAFETAANIYAPYYRQADAAALLNLSLEEQDKVQGSTPKEDVFAAFDYYIKNCNDGRPFILAGHSQGSKLLTYLLSEYMGEHPDVYKRMIAAYVIGYSITPDYLAANPHLKFAEGPDDTGVIISYNTQSPEYEGSNPVVLPGALVINPITWTRDETLATSEESLGSLELNEQGEFVTVKNYADAQVSKAKGAVLCSTVDPEKLYTGSKVFGVGIFHGFDYPLYYYNIKENAENRTRIFLSRQ